MAPPFHKVEFIVQECSARIGNVALAYFDIAQQAYAGYLEDDSQRILAPEFDRDPSEYFAQSKKLFSNAVKTVVFSAMTLEAGIYDVAAIQLGDKFSSGSLDKLDLVAKWHVVPRLVCGKSLGDSSPGLNLLRVLVRSRNALVHAKSQPVDFDLKSLAQARNRSKQLERDVHEAFKCVVLLSLELNKLFGTTCASLPVFEKSVFELPDLPRTPKVQQAIERAREIHARNGI